MRRSRADPDPSDRPAARQRIESSSGDSLENGVLRSLTLTHFKAHSHFHIDFGSHVNFIVGSNGTGKSAILAGIIQALGGNPNKHSSTAGGAKAAQGLVQDGKDYSVIELVLHNGSEDPYIQPNRSSQSQLRARDELDSITIRNELTRMPGNKASGYRRKRHGRRRAAARAPAAARGAPVTQDPRAVQVKSTYKINGISASRKEVAEVAEHFNLQVENPCAILTQAVHATFLRNAKDGRKRYDFFLAACNADVVRDRLRGCHEHHTLIATALAAHEESGVPLSDRLARCRALVEKATQRDRLEREVSAAEGELAWAEVGKAEAEAEEAAAAVGELEAKREAAERARANIEEQQSALRAQTEELMREREARMAQLGAANKAKAEAAAAHRRAQRGAAEAESGTSEVAAALRAARTRQANIEANYAKSAASLETDRRAAMDKLTGARAAAEAEAAAATTEANKATEVYDRAMQEARGAKARGAEASKRATLLKSQADETAHDVGRARSAAGDVLRTFDAKMPQLVEAIRQAQWPSGVRPTGPLGANVRLKSEMRQYASVVENALGGLKGLGAFVVDSFADERALLTLIARVAPSLSRNLKVIIQKAEARFQPRRTSLLGFPTVLDAIEVADVCTFNALLNNSSPENVLLIQTYDDAKRLWATNQPFRAYDMELAVYFTRGSLQAREPPMKDGASARGLIAMDSADVIRGLEEQHASLASAAAEAGALAQRAAREEQAARRAEEEAGRERSAAASRAKAADRALAVAVRAALVDEVDDRLGSLRSDLDEMNGEVKRLMREQAEREAAAAVAAEAVPPALRMLKAAEADVRSLGGVLGGADADGTLDERLKAATAMLHKHRQAVERAATAVRTAVVAIEVKSDAAAGVRARVQALFPDGPAGAQAGDAADGATQPVGAPASTEALKKKLAQLQASLKKAERETGGANAGGTTYAALVDELREAEAAVEVHAHSVAAVRATAASIEAALNERHKFHRRSIKAYGRQAIEDFSRHLSHRTLGGSLAFDHKCDTLEAEVCPNGNDPTGRATSSLRSLSGGEQAFSTLALVLAMWQLSATPLRAMDEFDKNMDSNYQTASLVLLFETFRRQPGRQFLILTPLDYSGLLADAGVKEHELVIHRMPEVVRQG